MKLNIAYPEYRSQQLIEEDNERKLRIFYDKRISEEVDASPLGDEWKGYVLKITGGHDKQGFGMLQGVLLNHRTRLLLDGRTGHYTPKRDGARKRKSVRGCIVGADLSSINLIIVKRGPADIPNLTDKASDRPSTRGPKRASNIRKVWGLTKEEDVRRYVVRRKIPGKDGKKDRYKSPKIQRLVTPTTLYRKRKRLALKKQRHEKLVTETQEYQQLIQSRRQASRAALLSKKRKSEKKSVKEAPKAVKEVTKPVVKASPKPTGQAAQKAPPKGKQTKVTKQTKPAAKTAATKKPTGK